MAAGAYQVTDNLGQRSIGIDLIDAPPNPVPHDQVELADEIDKTLTVLLMLFSQETDKERFSEYFRPLVEIARNGLEGADARAEVARRALAALQNQVTTREAGRVKHRYMKRLAKYAGTNSGILLLLAFGFLLATTVPPIFAAPVIVHPNTVACFFFLLSGCSAGVWLSFGARRPTLTFYELHIPEPDQLHPAMRVAFVIALTVILSLLFHHEVISLGIGNLKSAKIYSDPTIAWLFGALCGFSEQLLSTQVSEQTGKLFPGKTTT